MIDSRLKQVRDIMKRDGISAVVIPSTDPHSSEYVHPHWKFRAWLSGFKGSAGTLIITHNNAGLWTDFRYFIEAGEAIKGSEFELFKMGIEGTPSFSNFLNQNLSKGDIIGIDGSLFTTTLFETLNKEVKEATIIRDFFLAEEVWVNRPEKPQSIGYGLDIKYSGEDRISKISRIREEMVKKDVDTYIISSLSDIAWLFNIRGGDIDYTPLLLSYAVITKESATLYVDSFKLDRFLKSELDRDNITVRDYSSIADDISIIGKESTVYYNPNILNSFLSSLISDVNIKRGDDLTERFKSIKNSTQIENTRRAMEKDGAALVRFFKEVEERVANGDRITEFSLAGPLRDARVGNEGCVDESFAPIIGYKSNGALCHYSADKDSAKIIEPRGLLLVDSGGQYLEGTTDITRTITLGEATEEEILHYTLVLKGHIAISLARFPKGTNGGQLDILARKPLWDRGLNYGHGTGHGVGYFLGVHEGPQNISPKSFKYPLEVGQITSNEPGIYIEGSHGIRVENLILTKPWREGLYEEFLEFETLTLFPYDLNLIDRALLDEKEVSFINEYHKEVYSRLSPLLNNSEANWLKDKTVEI